MNEKVICEVMLYAYKDLEAHCKKIDEKALRVALASMNRDVHESADEIIRLTDEKIAYCNTKVIIDEALKGIGRHAELKAFYIDGVDYKDIIQREAITERGFFHRLRKQKEKLYQYILDNHKGQDLLAMISDSKWLSGEYIALLKAEREKQNEK